MVLTRGMVDPAGIALVLRAQLAAGIGSCRQVARRCDRFWIFFRLRQIDRDVQLTVFGRCFPLNVLCDPVAADVIGILTKAVIPVGRMHRVFCI